MSRAALALLAALLLLLGAAQAQAVPVLAEADATELSETLKRATAAQDVCYGWAVSVDDQSGGASGEDLGSDKGVGARVERTCAKWVELQGGISYTCDSCEAEDGAGIAVEGNFPGAPSVADLEQLGFSGDDLLQDDSDVALSNLVGALPLITASNGAAPAVPPPSGADAPKPAAGDGPTGTPSTPDWLRESWLALTFFLVLALGGLVWLVRLALDDREARRAGPNPFTP